MGYGLIEDEGGLTVLGCGVFEIKQKTIAGKIKELNNKLTLLLKKNQPQLVAIEKLYFTNNQKTAIEVAEARGVIISCIVSCNIPLVEYGPKEIKQALTNDGNADKRGVARMVCRLLHLPTVAGPDDVTDALAIAIVAAHRYRFEQKTNAN